MTHTFLGGWQWSGITLIQSGSPFSVYNEGFNATADNAGVGNGFSTAGSYPDLVGNPKSGVSSSPLAGPLSGFGPLLYNPDVFVLPTGLTFGDAGRNILRNPWRTNFDMALIKHFPVTESKYFEFRAEAFNVFNHVEYTWLGGDAGSAANNSAGEQIPTKSPVTAAPPRREIRAVRAAAISVRRVTHLTTHHATRSEVYFLLSCGGNCNLNLAKLALLSDLYLLRRCHRLQRVLQICDQIVCILDPHRETDHLLGYPHFGAVGGGDHRVRSQHRN